MDLLSSSRDFSEVGAKAARLQDLLGAPLSMPVPPALAIPAGVYRSHLELVPEFEYFSSEAEESRPRTFRRLFSSGQLRRSQDSQELTLVKRVADALLKINLSSDLVKSIECFLTTISLGKPVALRSSCVKLEDLSGQSFAGHFETVLNVQTIEAACNAVRRVWASVWSPRVISLLKAGGKATSVRKTLGLAGMAVVIQVQVDSRSSGVAFTRSPVGNQDSIMVESVWGQGQGIVDGTIAPDRYWVSRSSEKPVVISQTLDTSKRGRFTLRESGGLKFDDNVPCEPSLSSDEVIKIAEMSMKIEEFYGFPQDIEFCFDEKNQCWILQARPVTTLQNTPKTDSACPISKEFLPPDPEVTYYLDSIHVYAPISGTCKQTLIAPFNRGFHDASQVYGAEDSNQIVEVNDFIYGFVKKGPGDEKIRERIFDDKNYIKELQEWHERAKPKAIKEHLELQHLLPEMTSFSNEDLWKFVSRCWDHLMDCWYIHGRYCWAHRVVIGDLMAHMWEWSGHRVSGFDVMNALSRLTIGTPNTRLPVLLRMTAAFNKSPVARKHALSLSWQDERSSKDVQTEIARQALDSLYRLDFHDRLELADGGQEDSQESRQQLREAMKMFDDYHSYLLVAGMDVSGSTMKEYPQMMSVFCRRRLANTLNDCSMKYRQVLLNVIQDDVRRFCVRGEEKPSYELPQSEESIQFDESNPEYVAMAGMVPEELRNQFRQMFQECLAVSVLKNERCLYTDSWASGILHHALLEVGRRLEGMGVLIQPQHVFECSKEILEKVMLQGRESLSEEELDDVRRHAAQFSLWKSHADLSGAPKMLGVPPRPRPTSTEKRDRLKVAVDTFRASVGHMDSKNKLTVEESGVLSEMQPEQRSDVEESDLKKKGRALCGIGASQGVTQGVARYISSPNETVQLRRGEVAVITAATPAFSAVLACCSAVVAEQGGVLCHIAIVARELRLPAVVGCLSIPNQHLTPCQLDGHVVRVDGTRGIVYLTD